MDNNTPSIISKGEEIKCEMLPEHLRGFVEEGELGRLTFEPGC